MPLTRVFKRLALYFHGRRVHNASFHGKHPMLCGSKKKYRALGWSYRSH